MSTAGTPETFRSRRRPRGGQDWLIPSRRVACALLRQSAQQIAHTRAVGLRPTVCTLSPQGVARHEVAPERPPRRLSGKLRSTSRAGHGRSPTSSMMAAHSTHWKFPSPMGLNASHRCRSVGGCCDALLLRTVSAIVPATHTPASMARLPQTHIAAPLAVVFSKIPRRARGNVAQLRPGRQDGRGACRAHGGNH